MPSIRIPRALRKALRQHDHGDGPAPPYGDPASQPPIADGDPRLHAFLRVNFDVLYDWNVQTGAVYFSEQIDGMLGLPPGGFPRTFEGWLGFVHPEDHDAVCDDLGRCVTAGSPFHGEYRLRRADGTYLTVSDQGVILGDGEKKPTSMIGAMRDVTGERETERALREADELRRALFRLPSPVMQVDREGRYLDADEHALAFFERDIDQMLAAGVGDDFPPELLAAIGDDVAEPAVAEFDVTCLVNGRTKTLLLNVIPTHRGDERDYFLLGTDITGQRAMQEELARSERALRRQATILDERNAALRVLLEQREQDREELRQRIVGNVEQLIEPTLDRLSRALRHRPERLEVEALRVNLREIAGPLAQSLNSGSAPLTRRETEVANLVRLGKSSVEIAEALHISTSSVAFHRANIRRKLGLPKRGPHLATHLAALGRDRSA